MQGSGGDGLCDARDEVVVFSFLLHLGGGLVGEHADPGVVLSAGGNFRFLLG